MEIFSALLAFCAGNSPVTGEFPTQRPVTRNFDVSLICTRMNGWVNNHEPGDLRCHRAHYYAIVMFSGSRAITSFMSLIAHATATRRSQVYQFRASELGSVSYSNVIYHIVTWRNNLSWWYLSRKQRMFIAHYLENKKIMVLALINKLPILWTQPFSKIFPHTRTPPPPPPYIYIHIYTYIYYIYIFMRHLWYFILCQLSNVINSKAPGGCGCNPHWWGTNID